ncbi:MAG: N-acetylglucosamine-6-phosphate deacetylase, partial [Bacilli bacterium]
MIIKGFKNVNVYVEGQGIVKKCILIKNGKIDKIVDNCEEAGLIELSADKIVVPGFIDEHVHGANHSDGMYTDPKDPINISKTIASEGVTSYCITTMTQTVENIDAALKNAKQFIDKDMHIGAKAIGIHLEGPFISRIYKGAQVLSAIQECNVDLFKHFQEVSGNHISIVTLAYEENGKELVHYLKKEGIVASLGHTNATYEEAMEGIKEGITCATHTYNAMTKLHHREVGVVGTVLLCDQIRGELICDLIHISAPAIQLLYKCKGKDGIILVTDAMEAKHLPDGEYALGGQPVFVSNGAARLKDGTLAGSILYMNHAIKNIQKVLG